MNQILIVDNQPENCEAIANMLSGLEVALLYCHSGEDAITHIREVEPSLVLLDADMPNMDGYQVINQMWADDDLRQVPVLLMTTHFSDRKQLLHQPLLEVVDSLPKPINAQLLVARVSMALTMRSHQRTIVSVLDDGGQAIRKRHEGVLAVDGEGRITFANATALALLRTNHQMMFGVYLESIFEEPNHHVESAWHEHPVQRMCAQGNVLQVESCQLYCADGNTIKVKMAAIPMAPESDIAMVIAFRQIEGVTPEGQEKPEGQVMLQFDSLTGTYIRQAFEQVIDDRIKRNESTDKKIAVIQIDLAHFNHVNETLGHEVGDRMLKDVVSRIQKSIRPIDRIGRIGGDVFAIMIDEVQEAKAAGRVAQKIIDSLKESFLLEGFELFIGCNLGITTYPECGKESSALLKNSAIAVDGAKLAGLNSYQFFTAKMNEEMLARIELESSLHHALERGEVTARVEPLKLESPTASFLSTTPIFTVRLQWHHPRFGCDSTSELLDLLERYGATEVYRTLVLGFISQFMAEAGPRAVLMVPISLRMLMTDRVSDVLKSTLPDLQANRIGWLLQENGLGRVLINTKELLADLTEEGYCIGIESITGNYLSSCLNQLELSLIVLHTTDQLSPKQRLLGNALEQVAGALDIAVCKL